MGSNNKHLRTRKRIEPQFFIFLFSLLILLVFIVAFVRPVFPTPLTKTEGPTLSPIAETPQMTEASEITPTPTSLPPTPEEIGYTDGIIFWATVLVIILLVGTLRETLRRKGE